MWLTAAAGSSRGGSALRPMPARRAARQTPARNHRSPSSPPAQLTLTGGPRPRSRETLTSRSAREAWLRATMRCASRDPPRARRSTAGASAAMRATGSGEATCPRKARGAHGSPQPLSPDPEGRALITEKRSPAPRACPSSVGVAAESHGARAGEEKHARADAERAEVGRLDVRDHSDPTRERAKSSSLAPAFGGGPDPLRRHDERLHVGTLQRPALPEACQEGGKRAESRRRPRDLAAPGAGIERDHTDPAATQIDADPPPPVPRIWTLRAIAWVFRHRAIVPHDYAGRSWELERAGTPGSLHAVGHNGSCI
jgi:hypothetical protein